MQHIKADGSSLIPLEEKLRIGKNWKPEYDWEDAKICFIIQFNYSETFGAFQPLHIVIRILTDLEVTYENDEYRITGDSLYDNAKYERSCVYPIIPEGDLSMLRKVIKLSRGTSQQFTIFVHNDNKDKITDLCSAMLDIIKNKNNLISVNDVFNIIGLDKKNFPTDMNFKIDDRAHINMIEDAIKKIQYFSTLAKE